MSPAVALDPASCAALLSKYNVAGPRYTSYPTAPYFRTDFDHRGLREEFGRDNAVADAPLSLYVHLPFCEQRCWFCGCTTVITRNHGVAGAYLDDLEREMDLIAASSNHRRPVIQVHLGGGTPTFLQPEELLRLGRGLRSRFAFDGDVEFSVEIDPRHLTSEQVEVFRLLGCTRASLGIQDFNTEVQLAVHRFQPREMTEIAVARLREAGFASINFDLIYGLPCQTPDSFQTTLDEALKLSPDRLAVFSYAHVPGIKPAQRIFDRRENLPSAEAKLKMMTAAVETLSRAEYACIGMDHFARQNDELAVAQRSGRLHRNFQGYTTRAGASLYGFGMSSISYTAGSYRQNFRDLGEYRKEVRAGRLPVERAYLLTPEDRLRQTVIQRIMCDGHLSFARLSAELGVDFAAHFQTELQNLRPLAADGLCEIGEEELTITPLGRLLVRVIAMRFDAYLGQGQTQFSKTV